MLGTRLHTSDSTIGSLNLYDVRPGAFTGEDRDVAHILGPARRVALAATREQTNLWKAIDARQLIGQAQGILMERFAIDADQAFGVLRRYSQDHNIKLRKVATAGRDPPTAGLILAGAHHSGPIGHGWPSAVHRRVAGASRLSRQPGGSGFHAARTAARPPRRVLGHQVYACDRDACTQEVGYGNDGPAGTSLPEATRVKR